MKCCSFCCQGKEDIDIWYSSRVNNLYICNAPECMDYLKQIREQYNSSVRPRRYITQGFGKEYLEETVPDAVEDFQDYLVRKTKLEGTQIRWW